MATERLKKKIGKGRHRSAIKRERQNKKRRIRNRATRSALKTAVKEVRTARTKEALTAAIPIIDKTATKGVIPKQRASRLVSRLTKYVNTAG